MSLFTFGPSDQQSLVNIVTQSIKTEGEVTHLVAFVDGQRFDVEIRHDDLARLALRASYNSSKRAVDGPCRVKVAR